MGGMSAMASTAGMAGMVGMGGMGGMGFGDLSGDGMGKIIWKKFSKFSI